MQGRWPKKPINSKLGFLNPSKKHGRWPKKTKKTKFQSPWEESGHPGTGIWSLLKLYLFFFVTFHCFWWDLGDQALNLLVFLVTFHAFCYILYIWWAKPRRHRWLWLWLGGQSRTKGGHREDKGMAKGGCHGFTNAESIPHSDHSVCTRWLYSSSCLPWLAFLKDSLLESFRGLLSLRIPY